MSAKSLFADMVEPGAKVGMLTEDLCEELQIESVPVIAVAGSYCQFGTVARLYAFLALIAAFLYRL